jgi:hypothetical protein
MTYTNEQIDARIRATAPRDAAPDWHDVRRRARRRRRPLVFAGGAVLAIVLVAPALAFRDDLTALWATAEPDRNLYVRAFADCGEGSFTLEFDPVAGASITQGDTTLAAASLTKRTIECDAPIQTFKGVPDASPYHGASDKRSYSRVTLECSVEVPLQVAVNPIWEDTEIRGSTMLAADRRTNRVVASAVLTQDPEGRNWSRAYWSSKDCTAPGGYDPTVPSGVAPSG